MLWLGNDNDVFMLEMLPNTCSVGFKYCVIFAWPEFVTQAADVA
jgi:hypothetical protein